MTKISLNSDNATVIYNLVSNAKTKITEAQNACRSALQSCPSYNSYGRPLDNMITNLEGTKKNIGRVSAWFDLLKERNDRKNEESETRLDQIEEIEIKRHDLYVK